MRSAGHFCRLYSSVIALCLVLKRPSMNDCAPQHGMFCDDLCRGREGDAEEVSREILKELVGDWEELDEEMVGAEF